MGAARRRRRWSIDLEEQASVVEQLAGGALVVAALLLAGLGAARAAGAHPTSALFFGALALAGAGVVVLTVSFGTGMARRARLVVWVGRADASTAGVLLFLLEPAGETRDPAGAVTGLGALRCRASFAGPLVGEAGTAEAGERGVAGDTLEAPDDRIARIGPTSMTRYHPSFFAGAPDPASGRYELAWEEQVPEGGWRTLFAGTVEVTYLPLLEPAEVGPQVTNL